MPDLTPLPVVFSKGPSSSLVQHWAVGTNLTNLVGVREDVLHAELRHGDRDLTALGVGSQGERALQMRRLVKITLYLISNN